MKEGKVISGTLISSIRPDPVADTQCDWFAPNTAAGLMQAGLSSINQSIESFIYCILGVQVNIRSSILGEGRRAKEAQTEFLTLMEDAIRQPDLSQSVQRYQLAVDQPKVWLNLAVCPGAWLMPARVIINTESTAGYNNKLKQAGAGMKLGVNNDINAGTNQAGLQLMEVGPSKITPIYKDATAARNPKADSYEVEKMRATASDEVVETEKTPQHEIHQTAAIIGVVGVTALLLIALR